MHEYGEGAGVRQEGSGAGDVLMDVDVEGGPPGAVWRPIGEPAWLWIGFGWLPDGPVASLKEVLDHGAAGPVSALRVLVRRGQDQDRVCVNEPVRFQVDRRLEEIWSRRRALMWPQVIELGIRDGSITVCVARSTDDWRPVLAVTEETRCETTPE